VSGAGGGERAVEAVLQALERVAEALATTDLAAEVAAESRLHSDAARRGLEAWVRSIDGAALSRLLESARRPGPTEEARPVLTLAPGTVPVVAAECVLLGILAGGRHEVALSTRAGVLARATGAALAAVAPEEAARIELFAWRALDDEAQRARLARARRVVVYGAAETVEWVAARAGDAVLVPHGPSIAVAAGRVDELGGDALARLATDIATWEQRGCRSPHALVVLGARGKGDVGEVARALAAALEAEAGRLPVVVGSDDETAIRYLDRLTSRHLGWVSSGVWGCVSAEASARALRVSPLGRTVRVVGAADGAELGRLLGTLPAPCNLLLTPTGAGYSALGVSELRAFGGGQGAPFDRLHDGLHRVDTLR
jgi:hypothetical protein